MLEDIIIALVSSVVGCFLGVIGALHYVINNPEEYQAKLQEKL